MRKAIVLVIALSLVAALVGPAAAKRPKKRAKPPVTFEAAGSILAADLLNAWVADGPTSITARDFLASCEIPENQGFDAFVIELSDEISKVPAGVRIAWPEAVGSYHLHMDFFDSSCIRTGFAGHHDGPDGGTEDGTFPAGTKYVMVTNTLGAAVEFTLKAKEIRPGRP